MAKIFTFSDSDHTTVNLDKVFRVAKGRSNLFGTEVFYIQIYAHPSDSFKALEIFYAEDGHMRDLDYKALIMHWGKE